MASDRRSITTVLRAETGQYARSMDSAAKATARVGDAADKASRQTEGLGKSGKGIGDGAAAGARKGESALDRMSASISKNEQAWQGVGTTLTVAGGAVTAFGAAAVTAGIEYNTLQQTSRAALESLLGSAQAANEQMDKLDEFARTSPFSKQTFITAQQQMLAFGIEAQKVIPYLDAIQNAVAAAGGSNADIEGIVAVMSKIQSSAKITAQDLMEFGNRGVNAAELIGSQMGMTGAQVRDSITDGTLDAQAALDALAAGMSDRFSGAADNVKNTFAGAMDRVKAAWRDFGSELAAPLVSPEGGGALVDMLNLLADAMRGFQGLPEPLKETITLLGGFAGVAATATGGLILMAPKVAELVANFSAWRKSAPVVSGALGDMAKAVGGVMAVVTAFQLLDAATRQAGPSLAEIENRLVGVNKEGANAGSVLKDVQSEWDPMGISPLAEPKTKQDWQDLLTYLDQTSSGFGAIQNTVGGWFGLNDDIEATRDALEGTGTALAEMASTDLSGAQQGFKQFVDAAGGGEEVTRQLLKWMPAYRDALMEQANAAGMATDEETLLKIATGEVAIQAQDAAGSVTVMASAQEQLASALESSNPRIAAVAETYKALIDGADKAGGSFLDLSDDLGEAEFSLDGWLKKLERQAEATRNWADNIQTLAEKGASVNLLQGLIDQGPAAAQAVDALANGTEKDMKRAERAIGGVTGATSGLQSVLSEDFVLQLQTDAAKRQGKSTEEYISDLQATIEVTGNTVPARKEGESAEKYISRLLAVMGIDANGVPARKEGESTRDYIKRLKGAIIKTDANSKPARKEGESTRDYIKRLKGAIIKVNANTDPADDEVDDWIKKSRETVIKIAGKFLPGSWVPKGDGEGAGWSGATPRGVAAMTGAVRKIDPSAHITSGYRPGAVTATGFPSYHGLGRAIDIVSPNMGRTWDLLRAQFGSRAKELYHTPRGFIRNGRMTNDVSPVTRATHYSHVHLALAKGGAARGPGTGTSDRIPAWLSNGEHVLTAADVRKLGGQQAVYRLRAAVQAGRFSNLDPEPTFATGGAVGSATRALRGARGKASRLAEQLRRARKAARDAEQAERRAEKSKSKSDDKRTRKRSNQADKKVSTLEKKLESARDAASNQAQRLSRLRSEARDTRTDLRRGEVRESATGSLSGAYSVVDEMLGVARSGDLTKRQSKRLSKSAGNAERTMKRLYGQADRLEKKLESATEQYEELLSIKESVASSISGGFQLGEVTSPWTGGAATTGKEYLASAQAYAAKTKTFAVKLKALQKKGYSGVILQEVASMGVEEGTVAADALLQLDPGDTKAMNAAYKQIDQYAGYAGNWVTKGFYEGGVLAAKGIVKGLESQQNKVEKQILKIAKAMEKALKKALGIKSPSTVFRDLGLQTGAGMVEGLNASVGAVARASEQLAHVPATVAPSVYANPSRAGASNVVAVVDKGAMADAMNGVKMTLLVDGKPIEAIAQTTVDRNLAATATSLRGGRR